MDHREIIWIKKEETDVDPDEPGLEVVESTKCASNTTRLIQNSGKSCGISIEETVMQGHVPNELEVCEVESAHLTMFDTQTQGLEEEEDREQEENLLAARVKCSLRENEFHTFSCNFCLQSFTSKYRLIKHVFFHMAGLQPPTCICKSCGEVFSSVVGLNKHLKMNEEDSSTHHNHKTDCVYKYENISLESYEKQCSSQLKSQAVRAPGTRSHKCDICGKSFSRLNNLKCHRLIHTGMRSHKCDVCGRSFTSMSNLNKHVFIHTGLRPHKCNVCGKSFNHLGSFKAHLLIHTGIKPHKCDVCGKGFSVLTSLRDHTLRHIGIRRRKCDVCGKTFTELDQLKEHASIHTITQMSSHM